MYFYKVKNNQYLDLSGNFILSHNDQIIKAKVKSAAPIEVYNAIYIVNIKKLGFYNKLKLIFVVIQFIWGRDNLNKTPLE